MKKKAYYKVLLAMLTLFSATACHNTGKSSSDNDSGFAIEDEEEVADTIEGQKVSKECAVVCSRIDRFADRMERVSSPDALIAAKQTYEQDAEQARNGMENLSDEEKSIAQHRMEIASSDFEEACRKNEVPSSGVIANLNNLIRRIDKVTTYRELRQFEDCRLGMLRNLDNIHLCVERGDRHIGKVKQLAQVLKGKWEKKRETLNK